MVLAVEDILNAALRRVKYPTPIGSIYEGSRASRIALDYYGQIRDAVLRERDWGFARQTVSLGAALKTAPAGGYGSTPWSAVNNPPLPWGYEYAYPMSCIMVRSVRPTPVALPERNVFPNIFVVGSDTASGSLVVLTNLLNAQATITGRVTNPAAWNDAGFLDALIEALAVEFERQFAQEQNPVQTADRDAEGATMIADMRRG